MFVANLKRCIINLCISVVSADPGGDAIYITVIISLVIVILIMAVGMFWYLRIKSRTWQVMIPENLSTKTPENLGKVVGVSQIAESSSLATSPSKTSPLSHESVRSGSSIPKLSESNPKIEDRVSLEITSEKEEVVLAQKKLSVKISGSSMTERKLSPLNEEDSTKTTSPDSVNNSHLNQEMTSSTTKQKSAETRSVTFDQKYQTLSSPKTNISTGHSGNTTGATVVGGQNELSLPGFLFFEDGSDYQCYKQIGSGSTATVWAAKVVSEELRTRAGSDECVAKRIHHMADTAFNQEVALMWFFRDNPHFVKLCGYSTEPYIIIMKFYRYGNLEHYLHQKRDRPPMTPLQMAIIVTDVSNALAEMHKAGFAHCDLKPANILLERDKHKRFRGVLSDFGITRVVQAAALLVAAFQTVNVEAASVAYAAPEVVRVVYLKEPQSETVDPRTIKAGDTYSFAITIYEIVTSSRPWLSVGDAKTVIEKVVNGLRPDIPDQTTQEAKTSEIMGTLLEVMQECWVQDPLDRPEFTAVYARLNKMLKKTMSKAVE